MSYIWGRRKNMRPNGSPRQLQERRERAIELLKQGNRPVDVARMLGVQRRSVRRWKAAYKAEGMLGIKAKRAEGRPPKLSNKQKKRLEKVLLKGAKTAGFNTDLWTCPRIAQIIEKHFTVKYHVDHVGRLLHSMGWTPQRPQRKAMERNERKIRRWVNQRWPLIKKNLSTESPYSIYRRERHSYGAYRNSRMGEARVYTVNLSENALA